MTAYIILAVVASLLTGLAGYDLHGWLQQRRQVRQEARQRLERKLSLQAAIRDAKDHHRPVRGLYAELRLLTNAELRARSERRRAA